MMIANERTASARRPTARTPWRPALRSLVAVMALALAASGVATVVTPAIADPVADFYRGKTMTVLIAVSAGGEYDLHGRLIARYIGRYVPGTPQVIAQNMLGAAGLTMGNYVANIAPRDGTTTAIMMNGFAGLQALNFPNVQYDVTKFNWIGSISPIVETLAVWRKTGVSTIEEARRKELVIGAVGRGSITQTFPRVMNELLGTRFKIVGGYPGGNDINIAMERGEVDGRNNTWSSWKVTRASWLAKNELAVLTFGGPRPADLPDVPSMEELAANDDDRKLVQLVFAGTKLGRPYAATPGVPADRVEALRVAFMAAMKDPDFLKEAAAGNIDVDPVTGAALLQVVSDVIATPPHIKARAKPLME